MKHKIFYGWWVVLSLIPATLVHAGALFYIFGIFYEPLMREFGWSRATVAGALTIYLLSLGFSGPFIGRLADRFGPKNIIGYGAFFGGIFFILLSRIDSLWQFYGLYFLHGIAFAGCGNVPVNTALTNWFIKKRGRAIGFAMAGVSLGAITITPLGGFILQQIGWRNTYIFLALLSWIVVLPPLIWLMKNKPSQMGLSPDGNAAVEPEPSASHSSAPAVETMGPVKPWKLSTVTRTLPFWLICLAYFFIYFPIGAILGHQIVYITDMGFTMASAAAALGVTGGMGGVGKIVFGLLSDRFSPKRVTILCAVFQGIGIMFLLHAETMAAIWVYAIFFGFCMGGHLALQPLIVAYFFGVQSFGMLYGIIVLAGTIGTSTGPVIAGSAFDIFGTYYGVFAGCILLSWMAAVAVGISKRAVDSEKV
ncbi:MAG: MFS transporter [Desulfobacterales bacterium]